MLQIDTHCDPWVKREKSPPPAKAWSLGKLLEPRKSRLVSGALQSVESAHHSPRDPSQVMPARPSVPSNVSPLLSRRTTAPMANAQSGTEWGMSTNPLARPSGHHNASQIKVQGSGPSHTSGPSHSRLVDIPAGPLLGGHHTFTQRLEVLSNTGAARRRSVETGLGILPGHLGLGPPSVNNGLVGAHALGFGHGHVAAGASMTVRRPDFGPSRNRKSLEAHVPAQPTTSVTAVRLPSRLAAAQQSFNGAQSRRGSVDRNIRRSIGILRVSMHRGGVHPTPGGEGEGADLSLNGQAPTGQAPAHAGSRRSLEVGGARRSVEKAAVRAAAALGGEWVPPAPHATQVPLPPALVRSTRRSLELAQHRLPDLTEVDTMEVKAMESAFFELKGKRGRPSTAENKRRSKSETRPDPLSDQEGVRCISIIRGAPSTVVAHQGDVLHAPLNGNEGGTVNHGGQSTMSRRDFKGRRPSSSDPGAKQLKSRRTLLVSLFSLSTRKLANISSASVNRRGAQSSVAEAETEAGQSAPMSAAATRHGSGAYPVSEPGAAPHSRDAKPDSPAPQKNKSRWSLFGCFFPARAPGVSQEA